MFREGKIAHLWPSAPFALRATSDTGGQAGVNRSHVRSGEDAQPYRVAGQAGHPARPFPAWSVPDLYDLGYTATTWQRTT